MKKSLVKTSKFLSFVLRHSPQTIGLSIDAQGWVSVDELITKAVEYGKEIDLEILKKVVETNDKNRFSFSRDLKKIRANQGHSLKIDLGLVPVDPPEVLYHGTTSRFIDSILNEGLLPKNRNHVHLSKDVQTAIKVGSRHGKPVVLVIDTAKMKKDGYSFFLSQNKIWLINAVPPEYLSLSNNAGYI
jgi:putative RNA 2'-phosphotransferase